jgi:hypothetical protein
VALGCGRVRADFVATRKPAISLEGFLFER